MQFFYCCWRKSGCGSALSRGRGRRARCSLTFMRKLLLFCARRLSPAPPRRDQKGQDRDRPRSAMDPSSTPRTVEEARARTQPRPRCAPLSAEGIEIPLGPQVFEDFMQRRSGLVKALTTDVAEFYEQCDPEKASARRARRGAFPAPAPGSARCAGPSRAPARPLRAQPRLCCARAQENLCLYGNNDATWEVTLPAEEVPPELPEPALGINFARDGMQARDARRSVRRPRYGQFRLPAFCLTPADVRVRSKRIGSPWSLCTRTPGSWLSLSTSARSSTRATGAPVERWDELWRRRRPADRAPPPRRERLFKKINEHPTVYKTLSGEGGSKGGSKKKVRCLAGPRPARLPRRSSADARLAVLRRALARAAAAGSGLSVTTASGRCVGRDRRAPPRRPAWQGRPPLRAACACRLMTSPAGGRL